MIVPEWYLISLVQREGVDTELGKLTENDMTNIFPNIIPHFPIKKLFPQIKNFPNVDTPYYVSFNCRVFY